MAEPPEPESIRPDEGIRIVFNRVMESRAGSIGVWLVDTHSSAEPDGWRCTFTYECKGERHVSGERVTNEEMRAIGFSHVKAEPGNPLHKHLLNVAVQQEQDRMAYPKGFSPFRFHPGSKKRALTGIEEVFVGSSCAHCGKPLVRGSTKYSEMVHCPSDNVLFVDPDAGDEGKDVQWRMIQRNTTAGPALKFRKVEPSGGMSVVTKIAPGTLSPVVVKEVPTAEEALQTKRTEEASEEASSAASLGRAKAKIEAALKFPYATAKKLFDGVEAAHKQGKLGSGYSLRRQVLTARLWTAFQKVVDPKSSSDPSKHSNTALHLAFALIGSERATDDERPFYEELWKAQIGSKLYPLPTVNVNKNGQVWHPQAGIAIAAVMAGIPLWLAGEAGAGKTHLTRQIAKLLELRYGRLQGSRDRTCDDVIGAWGYDPAIGSVFRPGVVVEYAKDGGLLHIDEVSALPHEVTFEMHAILEGEPLTVLKDKGDVIPLHKDFRIVANDNSVGEGEATAYVGTHSTNLAFRDRWAFLRVESMPDAMKEKLVMAAAEAGA